MGVPTVGDLRSGGATLVSKHLPRTCLSRGQPKRQYTTEAEAMAEPGRGASTAYLCRHCAMWHIGRSPAGTLDRKIRRVFHKRRP